MTAKVVPRRTTLFKVLVVKGTLAVDTGYNN